MRTHKRIGLILAVAFLALGLCASGAEVATSETVGRGRDVQEVAHRLERAASACDQLSLDTIGQVRYDDFTAPIWAVLFEPPENAKHRVLLVGGIHGNEPAGCERLIRFVEALSQFPGGYPGIAFDIIPLVNPWGWVHDKRRNGRNLDLNRDFSRFKGQESVIVRDFARNRAYDLIVDLHEDSGAKGFYLYQIANQEDALVRRIIEKQQALGYPIEQDTWMVILKTKDGVIKARLWSLVAVKVVRRLSMTIYFRLTQCKRVYLFETPRRLPMQDRVTMHEAALELLLEGLAE